MFTMNFFSFFFFFFDLRLQSFEFSSGDERKNEFTKTQIAISPFRFAAYSITIMISFYLPNSLSQYQIKRKSEKKKTSRNFLYLLPESVANEMNVKESLPKISHRLRYVVRSVRLTPAHLLRWSLFRFDFVFDFTFCFANLTGTTCEMRFVVFSKTGSQLPRDWSFLKPFDMTASERLLLNTLHSLHTLYYIVITIIIIIVILYIL